jgi:hypothetical protein
MDIIFDAILWLGAAIYSNMTYATLISTLLVPICMSLWRIEALLHEAARRRS